MIPVGLGRARKNLLGAKKKKNPYLIELVHLRENSFEILDGEEVLEVRDDFGTEGVGSVLHLLAGVLVRVLRGD